MSNIKVDILVSGAGPVGLFFAYQMASRGHSVYCVDPKSGPTDQSRAILITARTMEILEARGLAAEVLSEAFIASGVRIFRNGVVRAQIEADADTPFSHITILMQGTTEKIFNNRLNEDTNCRVNWNTELVSYTQNDDCVTSIVRNIHTKEEQYIESTYIIGADGSHSRVRKDNPNWTYDGISVKTKCFVADLTVKGDNIKNMMDKTNVFMSGSNVMGLIRLVPLKETDDDSHHFRVFGNLEAYQRSDTNRNSPTHGLVDQAQEKPPTLEFLQSWIDKLTYPLKFEASDIVWSAYFKINERIANGFRKNRAFLIGDSAHCHSPVGGQGMNMGLQDADNLAWKMSEVLRNHAFDPEKLLNSYSNEREPQARKTIEMTSNTTKTGLSGSDFVGSVRTLVLTTALALPQLRYFVFNNLMQMYITIDSTSDILGTFDKGLIVPGQFLPDTGNLRRSLLPKSKRPHRVIQRNSLREVLIGNETYTAVLVATCLPRQISNNDLIEKFWTSTRPYPMRRLVIQSACHCHMMGKYPKYVSKEEEYIAEESFLSEERVDLSISVTNRVGLFPLLNAYFASENPPSVLLIIRPDLYVAHSKLVSNENELDDALKFISSTLA